MEQIYQVVGNLLDRIEGRSAPANDVVNDYFLSHRYLTPDERREILDLVWQTVRARARLMYAYPDMGWAERVAALCTQGMPDVSAAPDWVRWEMPEWLIEHIPQPEQELPPMLASAPIILRANGNRKAVMDSLQAEGLAVSPTEQSPYGIVLEKYARLQDTKAYKKGLLEIQDEGAQLVALDIGVRPKQDVFDFCAGAGGKSLILAQIMQNRGFIQAYDVYPKRLMELNKRASRCHISIIKTVTKLPEPYKKFDHVVVDAPCSGSGTWRRMPDMRWKFSEKQLAAVVALQAEILNRAEPFVKPGHYLTYITCSLTVDENEQQVEAFLKQHPNYGVLKQKRYSPYRTGTDGFFLCLMQKR